jgi:hypothetical protein
VTAQFILGLVAALAWPVTVVIIALVIRREIRRSDPHPR